MGLLDAANKKTLPQDAKLDTIGKALRDRILRIPQGADVPYTALSLLKAYGSFRTGVCLNLEGEVYTGYATVGLGLKKITVPRNLIFSAEHSGETYFLFRDDEKKVFTFIEHGMDIWCFALDNEKPWGAVLLLGSDTAPSIDPVNLSLILESIQRIIHPRYRKNPDAETPGAQDIQTENAIVEDDPAAEETADSVSSDFVSVADFEAEAELEEIPELETIDESEYDDSGLISFFDSTEEPSVMEELIDEIVEVEAITEDAETAADLPEEFEQLNEEAIDEVEPLDSADEEPFELTEPVSGPFPESTAGPAPEPAEETPAESPPAREPETVFVPAKLLDALGEYHEKNGLLDGLIINMSNEPNSSAAKAREKIETMVTHFAQVEGLPQYRCLLLFAGSSDPDLIAHRLKNSLNAEIPLVFTAKNPDEAYQLIQPYC